MMTQKLTQGPLELHKRNHKNDMDSGPWATELFHESEGSWKSRNKAIASGHGNKRTALQFSSSALALENFNSDQGRPTVYFPLQFHEGQVITTVKTTSLLQTKGLQRCNFCIIL